MGMFLPATSAAAVLVRDAIKMLLDPYLRAASEAFWERYVVLPVPGGPITTKKFSMLKHL